MDSHKIYRLIISNREEKHKKKAVEAGRIVVAVGPGCATMGRREPIPEPRGNQAPLGIMQRTAFQPLGT